jgi:peptide/nickel transport system substrate-binding protein
VTTRFFLRRRSFGLGGPIALATAIAVCGAIGGANAESTLPDEAAIKANAPESATFVYAVPSITTTLDYQPYEGDANRFVDIPLESKLILYDPTKLAGKGCDQLASITDLKGDLATEWSYSDDRKTITFKLRADAESEYGNKLTSADVKWSINRTIALSPIAKFNYFTIADYRKDDPVTIVDDHTVQIHVNTPTALDVIENLVFFAIIYDSTEAKKHATADDPWAQKWIQTHTANFGPWKIGDFQPGQEVTYVPNPNYYGDRGNITKFILRKVPDASTRRQLLEAGAVDWAARLSLNDYKSLQSAQGVTVRVCQSPNRDNLVLNLKNEILANTKVREAISMAIDRNAIVKGAYLGFGRPATTGLSSYYQYPTPSASYSFDVDKAKQILADAGYPNGFDLKLLYSPTRPGPMSQQSAILVQSMLAKIGIKVSLEQVASGTEFSSRFLKGQYDAIMWQEPPIIADPYFSAAIYNLTGSFQNSFGFSDPAYDELVHEVATTPPGDARDQKMAELAGLGVTDYPVLYLVDDVFLQAYRSNIAGYIAQPDGEVYPSELTKGK